MHALLEQLDDGTLRGCIVDLRRDTGGSLWPMFAGIGPLAGEGRLDAFVSTRGEADMSYDAVLGAARSGGCEILRVARPHPLRADLPVAVLNGPLTARHGKAIVVAFSGRERTRRFGEGTRGMPIGSTSMPLAAGAPRPGGGSPDAIPRGAARSERRVRMWARYARRVALG